MTTQPQIEELPVHGHRVCFRTCGEGPVIVLLHGVTGSSRQWLPVMELLEEDFTVVAPDLVGHGESAKPRGDYSLGAYASGVRDLLIALGHERATIVGHSLGGGIAMQFAYQFPERTERLVLVSSGGLGEEVHLLLRAATLPGSEFVLPLISSGWIRGAGEAVGRVLKTLRLDPGPDIAELARGAASLSTPEARGAFVHTLRAVIDPMGQRVDATDRLYLAEAMPSLIVWGERDPIIPVKHAHHAHRNMPGSRLELFEGVGHFPQLEEQVRFARTLGEFIDSTEPGEVEADDLREQLMAAEGGRR
jgi:pimeloyl-ACP methyl ester carboxylesterase